MRYAPLAHFPKSICLQRSLQKGKSSPLAVTSVRHVGQRKILSFFEAFLLMLDEINLVFEGSRRQPCHICFLLNAALAAEGIVPSVAAS